MQVIIGKSRFGRQWIYLGYGDSVVVNGETYILSGKYHVYTLGRCCVNVSGELVVDTGEWCRGKPIRLSKKLKPLIESRSVDAEYVRVKHESDLIGVSDVCNFQVQVIKDVPNMGRLTIPKQV